MKGKLNKMKTKIISKILSVKQAFHRLRYEHSSTIPPSPRWEPFRATLESFTKPVAMPHQIHTYTELRQQIHDDLRIQHPEWVEPNGESSMCDSYESRLAELLENFTRTGPGESIAAVHRVLNRHQTESTPQLLD
jgi:hypothetical protein